MVFSNRVRIGALLALLALAGCLLTACATVPPQPLTGAPPSAEPMEVAIEPSPLSSADMPQLAPDPTPSPTEPAQISPLSGRPAPVPTQVELFYSGMPSLMGFVDAPRATIYEYVMDALPACVNLCWPQATSSFYRYGADIPKQSMLLSKDQLLRYVSSPSFYLDEPMTKQPARVKRPDEPAYDADENFNEPIPSFYEVADLPALTSASDAASGTQVAVNASDPTSLTIIITDLHELRADDGALLSALNQHCLQAGRAIGVAAIMSEFSGYVPGLGTNNTAFVWGAPPTGSLDYLLDFSDYQVGISIDPASREMATRPFYVLCIGPQEAVDTYLDTLSDRLTREFAENDTFTFRTAVFGSGYVPDDYTLAGNMRYAAGQGVTAIADPNAPAGVSLIELKASQEARYLEWEVDYILHPSDPRGLSLTADDFTFMTLAHANDGAETVLPHLQWSILRAEGNSITLRLRLEMPQSILPQGDYTLEVLGSLAAPAALPGSEWLSRFGYDADGTQLYAMEQNTRKFDGSRTLFLSRLIDTLGKANIGRLGVAPLGTVSIILTVYA